MRSNAEWQQADRRANRPPRESGGRDARPGLNEEVLHHQRKWARNTERRERALERAWQHLLERTDEVREHIARRERPRGPEERRPRRVRRRRELVPPCNARRQSTREGKGGGV